MSKNLINLNEFQQILYHFAFVIPDETQQTKFLQGSVKNLYIQVILYIIYSIKNQYVDKY